MKRVLFVVAILLCATPAFAQTEVAVNPDTVTFPISADHAAINPLTGLPVIARYELRLFQEGAAQPFTVQDLGKPAPATDGTITAKNRAWFIGAAMNIRCYAVVAAIGPQGEGVSPHSNPFGNAPPPTATAAPVVK